MARDDQSDDAVPRADPGRASTSVEGAKRPSDEEFARFADLLHYLRMDLSQARGLRARWQTLAGRSAMPTRW